MINTTLIQNLLANTYEDFWPVLLLFFALGTTLYIFQFEISDDYRERKKLLNSASGLMAFPLIATVGYIAIQGYLLWLIASIILITALYLSYWFGLFDNILKRY